MQGQIKESRLSEGIMNSMLFACGGMRQGRHHLFDGVEQGSERAVAASFKQTIHKRIQESFGGTQTRPKDEALEDSVEDIRDEDFDTE